jgi:hypothetical protein
MYGYVSKMCPVFASKLWKKSARKKKVMKNTRGIISVNEERSTGVDFYASGYTSGAIINKINKR